MFRLPIQMTQQAVPYTQENNFSQAMQGPVHELWQQRKEGYISGVGHKKLFWISLASPSHTKAIVVVNGRMESTWKYQELFYDLFRQGFDIYSFDHRGQGLSDRVLDSHPLRGYVHHFNDYVQDMQILTEHFSLEQYQEKYILGHSMGGTIATRYLQTNPEHPFDAMALSAPMFGINMPGYLKPIGRPVSRLLKELKPAEAYAPGQKDYYAKPFENNPLTQSLIRYTWFRQLYKEMSELQLGGPTIHWVWQSLMAIGTCMQTTRAITIPTLILQAEKDEIVDNKAQHRFQRRLAKTNSHAMLKVMHQSRHEVLFEQDPIRNQALDTVFQFFSRQK